MCHRPTIASTKSFIAAKSCSDIGGKPLETKANMIRLYDGQESSRRTAKILFLDSVRRKVKR